MLYAPFRRRRVALLGAVVIALAVAAPAAAQDAATIKRLEQMNKRAMEDYDLLEFDSARKTLTDAVALVRSAGLEEGGHPIAAKTYLNLGVVYIGGFKDRDRGRMQFVRGLKVRPEAKLEAALATPELQEIFSDALKEVGKGRKPEPKPEPVKAKPEPAAGQVEGLVHEPINDARAGFPIVVKAELGAEINAAKVLLFYRGTGREDYLLADMSKNKKGVFTGQIPADAVQGKVLQYYIEVRDTRGRPLIANGSSGSPNIISVVEAAPGDGTPDGRVGGDDEDPLKAARIKKQREQEQQPTGPTIRGRRFWLTVGFGTGFGLATGHSECAWNEGGQLDGKNYSGYCVTWDSKPPIQRTPIKTGFAAAPMHLTPELGFYLGERFALSVQGRIQVLTLADPGAANGAPAFLARGFYFLGKEKVRYYVGGAVGGGYIRHRVALGAVATNADVDAIRSRDIVDTVKAGPFLFGPFAGVYYDITRVVGLQAEVNALAAAPEATFNIDINFGLNLNF